ncbi:MAG TPA: type I-E CRISPR-associated endonuclease Cas1e [bacterium]|nr:type I-E CRISPR-associated endonuclease Cas1e [bacterium]HPP12751.1 type I-E CRISPR-associated endonuclease Cas1e [bacterium]
MLSGRLGLETASIPHADRHGLLWLSRGNLYVEDGTLRFIASDNSELKSGDYAIPFQRLSMVLIGPGTTVTHDVFRLLARHGTALIAVGDDGVRLYTAPPIGPGDSYLARRQVQLWSNPETRMQVIRKMYAFRIGETPPPKTIEELRGLEGVRMREMYNLLARKYGIEWHGRRYDRSHPESNDDPNQAINHAATAVEAAATVAVVATGTIPALGFIHEDSSNAFSLDIADLFRDEITIPTAFEGLRLMRETGMMDLERQIRKLCGVRFRQKKVISRMIDRIKELIPQ